MRDQRATEAADLTACRDLWLVYLICEAWVDRCPDRVLKWAIRDAKWALNNYFDAVERAARNQHAFRDLWIT